MGPNGQMIRLPSIMVNGRPLPIHVHSSAGTAGPNGNPGTSNNRPSLPKLLPAVLDDAQQELKDVSATDTSQPDNDEHNLFKCNICYEIMQDPVGCGKCSARFCYSCLQRVAELSRQPQHPHLPSQQQTEPRCPVCRSVMSMDEVHRDPALRQRMMEADPVPCRYKDCDSMPKLHEIALHEQQCSQVKMQCAYASFGCNWKGKRSEWIHHEQDECPLAKVEGLVDRVRFLQSDAAHHMAALHQQMALTRSLSELQRQQQHHQLSTSNILQLAQYVYTIVGHTPRFLQTKDAWMPFHASHTGRAAVANFLCLLPTAIFMMNSISRAYKHMIRSATATSPSIWTSEEAVLDFLDGLLYLLIMICLQIVLGICFFAPGGTSESFPQLTLPKVPLWLERLSFVLASPAAAAAPATATESSDNASAGNSSNNANVIPNANNTNVNTTHANTNQRSKGHLVLYYSATFGLLASHVAALEICGRLFPATLAWLALCITSTAMPAMVFAMSLEANTGRPSAPDEMTILNSFVAYSGILGGRAKNCLKTALCYAPCIFLYSILPSIDAAVIFYLLGESSMNVPVMGRVPKSGRDEILSQLPVPALYAYAGARLAMKATDFPSVGWYSTLDVVWAFFLVFAIDTMVVRTAKVGYKIGVVILNQSKARVNRSAIIPQACEYHGLGMSFFAFWCLLLGALVIS